VVTALYRRYRPENFAELIGQSQVTDPLRTALRTNRVNHAYLFSGPRGCGKTTSARILARCLNCAEGPTDTPCGVCPSCVELAREGSGSLDVIEIDAASHNGVDDARDLRDRAVFAPARDRYKIFILDEAHMVTPQGFNALLKLVEEPPEHVKFIFATTEPEKVIGTIRSRTHHYPFRLVPPASMLEYVEQLCEQENVTVAPGVLPLVVRAGGGSVRDTLSLLDQLMAGSEDGAIAYDRAVALLGYTDAALLDDVVDALAVADPGSAFASVDRVVQTGQDPRRFVEDLLERLRDLIVVAATNEGASAVLRGVSPDELEAMSRQAAVFGAVALSRSADIANRALTDMTGATSPRLHLELMVARMLVPESDDTERGALSRVERLERRVGVGDAGGHSAPSQAPAPHGAASQAPTSGRPAAPVPEDRAVVEPTPVDPDASTPSGQAPLSSTGVGTALGAGPAAQPIGVVSLQQMRDSWPQIVEHVQHARRSAWTVVVTAQVAAYADDVLTLTFPSHQDVVSFKQVTDPKDSVSEYLRAAILEVLGVRVKFVARGPGGQQQSAGPQAAGPQPAAQRPPATPQQPAAARQQPATAPPAAAEPAAATRQQQPATPPPAAAEPAAAIRQQQPATAPPAAATTQQPPAPGPRTQERVERQADALPAAEPAAAPSDPVTDWVVATIPTSDPEAGAVPEDIEPAWAAPFGTATSAGVAPARTSGEPRGPQPDQSQQSSQRQTPTAQSPESSRPTSAQQTSAQSVPAVAPAGPSAPEGIPVDDYPLDDEPFDDGAPFPDPGPRGASPRTAHGGPGRPGSERPTAPAAQRRPTGSQQAGSQQAGSQQAGSQQAGAAATRTAQAVDDRPRRTPVPGRYGEAVVREILGAQFIEETALDDGGRGGF